MTPLKHLVLQCCARDFSLHPPNSFGGFVLHKYLPFIYWKPLRVQMMGPDFFSDGRRCSGTVSGGLRGAVSHCPSLTLAQGC